MPAENDAKQANGIPQRAENAPAGELFTEAVAIMARLRAPGGCPWDREQTFGSIRRYTLEETYEVLDAISASSGRTSPIAGDLPLQVLFYAEMAEEAGYFGIADVIAGLNRNRSGGIRMFLGKRHRPRRGIGQRVWRPTELARAKCCGTGKRLRSSRRALR